jgi:hypothetical protein
MSTRLLALAGVGALGAVTACSDQLVVPNYQNATVASVAADPVAAIPLMVTGVLRVDRGNLPGYVANIGVLGREDYNYSNTGGGGTNLLTPDVNSRTGGGSVLWGQPYSTIRNAFNTLEVIDSSGGAFTTAQRAALKGLLHTEIALSLLYSVNLRHVVGITVDTYDDPAKLAPFVSRDSALTYIAALLDSAQAELTAGGGSFAPVTLPSGFASFTTPATFAGFNRALAARVNAYRASLGGAGCGPARGATCYRVVLKNLQSSFIDSAGSLRTGVFNVYSSITGDVANSLSNQSNSGIVAHAKADSGVQLRVDGKSDTRFSTKVITLASPKRPPTGVDGVQTSFDYSIYAVPTDPIPVIRNEELILLRAEARYFTGDQAGALVDINLVRTKAGGLAARTSFSSEKDFLDELLYNRRWSLLFEGHRWIDMRRFGRLDQLTLDKTTHVTTEGLPIPQGECLQRANVVAALKGPGCPEMP